MFIKRRLCLQKMKEAAVLTHKRLYLKYVGVSPDQLEKLHAFSKNARSHMPFYIDGDVTDRIYSFKDGIPCVEVLTSKFEATEDSYRVELRVLTAVKTPSYRRVGETEDKVKKSENGFWITASSNILDMILKILDLSPTKESVVEEID